jgi:hypothetical protein
MRGGRALLSLLAALALAQKASAQPSPAGDWLDVSAHLVLPENKRTIGVGEPFKLVIEARHSPGGVALLPERLELSEELAERPSARKHERTVGADAEVDRYELELLAFEAGPRPIPAIPLALGSTSAATPRLEVEVATTFTEEQLPVATSTLAEAAPEVEKLAAPTPPPEPVMVEDYTAAWVVGALLLAALLAALLYRSLMRRRASPTAEPPPPPPRPAHEVALEALRRLEASGHLAGGRHKELFAELSTILRAYVGGRYGFDSLELTQEELLAMLMRRDTPGLDVDALAEVLERADLVKFAKYEASPSEGRDALARAFGLVEASRPRAESADASPGGRS